MAADDPASRIKDDIDRGDRQRRELRLDEVRPGGDMRLPDPDRGTPVGGPCFTVTRVVVVDAVLLGAEAVRRQAAALEGRCLTAADIASFKRALTALAFEKGFITTRVVVPEQNLASGELQLQVWPGRLEAFQVDGIATRTVRAALPLDAGDLLNLRALDQSIENLNRLESLTTRVDLLPGQSSGASIAAFTAKKSRPVHLALTLDGESLNDSPDNSARAALTWDDPAGFADRLVLGVNGSVEDVALEDANGWSAFYELPLGWWRLGVGAEQYLYDNTLVTAANHWRTHGNNSAQRVEIGRVLFRDAARRTMATLHGRERAARNYIDEVLLVVSSPAVRVAGVRVEQSLRTTAMTIDVAANLEGGDVAWPASVPARAVHDRYTRLDAYLRVQQALPVGDARLQLDGQWADGHLVPSEQFSVSGSSRVPGFARAGLAGDSGVAARLEYGRTYTHTGDKSFTWRPSVRLDGGWVPRRDALDAAGRAVAASVVASAQHDGVVVQLQAARPLPGPSNVPAARWQLDASLSVAW